MNIIADVAGQYDALLRLVAKMPREPVYTLGDLNDRGPNSKEVIQWAIDNDINAIMGNHEHMMLDYYLKWGLYDHFIWQSNGGSMTQLQYNEDPETLEKHLTWLKKRPFYYEIDGLFMSHGVWINGQKLEDACDLYLNLHNSIIWNREEPLVRNVVQVMGHNSHWGLKYFGDKEKPWAICLDDSRKGVVTGMHWPSMEIYQEPYIETKKQ